MTEDTELIETRVKPDFWLTVTTALSHSVLRVEWSGNCRVSFRSKATRLRKSFKSVLCLNSLKIVIILLEPHARRTPTGKRKLCLPPPQGKHRGPQVTIIFALSPIAQEGWHSATPSRAQRRMASPFHSRYMRQTNGHWKQGALLADPIL